MPRRDDLRRRRPFRNPLPRILIVCEGPRTEPGYFNELHHMDRIPIELEISPGGVPKTLVERAVTGVPQELAPEAVTTLVKLPQLFVTDFVRVAVPPGARDATEPILP